MTPARVREEARGGGSRARGGHDAAVTPAAKDSPPPSQRSPRQLPTALWAAAVACSPRSGLDALGHWQASDVASRSGAALTSFYFIFDAGDRVSAHDTSSAKPIAQFAHRHLSSNNSFVAKVQFLWVETKSAAR